MAEDERYCWQTQLTFIENPTSLTKAIRKLQNNTDLFSSS
jgi:hypothetical protein